MDDFEQAWFPHNTTQLCMRPKLLYANKPHSKKPCILRHSHMEIKGNHSDISDIIEVALKNIGCKSSI